MSHASFHHHRRRRRRRRRQAKLQSRGKSVLRQVLPKIHFIS